MDITPPASLKNTTLPLSPATSSHTSEVRIKRSCILCHQRKIRCDKKVPCSNCERADLLCCYPASQRKGPTRHKLTITDVAARLARLERTFNAMTNDTIKATESPEKVSQPATGSVVESSESSSPSEQLLGRDGYSSRYINEVLYSRIVDEEQELQRSMATPQSDGHTATMPLSFDISTVFSNFNIPTTRRKDYHPSARQAMHLWQIYLRNVNPVVKMLHIPTTQSAVFGAINNLNHVPDDLNALLFSIYFAAITSLSSSDFFQTFGEDRNSSLERYKQGLEQHLTYANILETPTLRSLQALTLYLTALRAHGSCRSMWIINGMAMRSAQSMGLHRDGKNFNLSPFESEIRRRLWWAAMANDSRAAEDHGITTSNLDNHSDTDFPLNVDDHNLHPDMTELPKPQIGWTEMSMQVIMSDIKKDYFATMKYRPGMSQSSCGAMTSACLDKLTERIESTYLKHLDLNIPIQQATLISVRIVLLKLSLVNRRLWMSDSDPGSSKLHPTEDALAVACKILDLNFQFHEAELLHDFRWLCQLYTQYDAMTYVLWHLCVKPEGPGTERAWLLINKTVDIGDRHIAFHTSESKWALIQRLKERAARIRAGFLSTDEAGLAVQASVGPILTDAVAAPDLTFGTDMDWGMWDMRPEELSDWNNIVKSFNLHDVAI